MAVAVDQHAGSCFIARMNARVEPGGLARYRRASRVVGARNRLAWLLGLLTGCGPCAPKPADHPSEPGHASQTGTDDGPNSGPGRAREGAAGPQDDGLPTNLPMALAIAYAQFIVEDGKVTTRPGPARIELLQRHNGAWLKDGLEDPQSLVFHKAMWVEPSGMAAGLLTLGGSPACPPAGAKAAGAGRRGCDAQLKLWHRQQDGWQPTTLWEEDFGGRFNRMRDAELGAVGPEGAAAIAVGTHDQGVVATVSLRNPPKVTYLGQKEDTFVHEVELGDLDGDGNQEIYTTPSDPNRLHQGGAQHGEVVRYRPGLAGEAGRQVVADLGNRHAKEILVGDVDGDGRDELYVVVEGLTSEHDGRTTIVEPVEIRRYDDGTAADAGVVIGTLPDRFTRFLTAGDFNGDGKKALVAATFRAVFGC